MVHGSGPVNLLKWIGLALTRYRFYRTWVTVRPVNSTKSCRPRDNSGYIRYPANGSRERTGERIQGSNVFGNARAGCRPACQEMRNARAGCRPACSRFWVVALKDHHVPPINAVCPALDWVHDIRRSEPYWGLSLSNRRVREVNRRMSSWPALGPVDYLLPRAGNLRFSPPYSYTTQDFSSFSLSLDTMQPSAPHPPRSAGSPSSSVSSGSSGSYHRECERSPRTPLPPPAPLPAPGPAHPVPRTPMMEACRYCNLFPRRRVAPPTPPSSPPPSDDEPSVERIDPEAELEGDPEEPYLVGDAYPGGYDAYVSDASYGSE
ncbi:hypothetical protein PIB30_022963 [Stylosanthes scabra]|uniref:Uncharacterized protein n=1 Tax=Stylosanthes scabra TaxID=79078 RepID=A0ABU6S9J0_9FABA|nr:hypothetical protein [Stylosanthes scabra]